jgi:hypothetical protein
MPKTDPQGNAKQERGKVLRNARSAGTIADQDLGSEAPEYEFSVAEGDDLAAARLLREAMYAPRFPGGDPWYLDSERDREGEVFLLRRGGQPVATLRILPVQSGRAELTTIRPLPEPVAALPGVWELGRVAAARPEAGHPPYMPLLFGWAAEWARSDGVLQHIVAYCRSGRLRGFAKLGAQPVDGPYALPGKGDDYYTISADLNAVLRASEEIGVTAFLRSIEPR